MHAFVVVRRFSRMSDFGYRNSYFIMSRNRYTSMTTIGWATVLTLAGLQAFTDADNFAATFPEQLNNGMSTRITVPLRVSSYQTSQS